MTTYTISDDNAKFSGLSADKAREMAAGWYADGDWGDDTDIERLRATGYDLSVEYDSDEDPADVAARVTTHVAEGLAQLRIDEGGRDHHCDYLRNELAACRLSVTEETEDLESDES